MTSIMLVCVILNKPQSIRFVGTRHYLIDTTGAVYSVFILGNLTGCWEVSELMFP